MKTKIRRRGLLLVGGLLATTVVGLSAVDAIDYGKLPDGRPVKSFILKNTHGLKAVILEYGATLASLETPDRNSKLADITLGYDTLQGWLSNTSHFGATVGRYANRIANGKFTLDGKTYILATNNSPGGVPCSLHGGKAGFDKKLWSGRPVERPGASGVELAYTSPDGEEGYPGTLQAKVTYWLTDKDELEMHFEAETDKPTVVNLTNHTYWNLTGDPRQDILGHRLYLESKEMLPVNAGLIPTGKTEEVDGNPFDFTRERPIGERISAPVEQIKFGNGFDHCWVLSGEKGVRLAAHAYEPKSGRVLELFTDQPGLQFYSGNFLNGSAKGKGGTPYRFRTAFCLEPEKLPDSPNQPQFQSAVLRPGETYRHTSVFRFYTRPSD